MPDQAETAPKADAVPEADAVPRGARWLTPLELRHQLGRPEWLEAAVTGDESPLVVVDMSAPDANQLPGGAPAPLPGGAVPWRIVVGVADEARPDVPIGIFDALLCSGPARPGWTQVEDVAAALDSFARTCATAPRAACTLTQLLRLNEQLPTAEATLSESLAYSMLLSGPEFAAWLAARRPMTYRPVPEPVEVGSDGDVVTLTFNRPEVRNAYDSATRDRLVDVLRALAALPSCPPVRLAGRGPTFCSGGDLSQFGTTADPVTAHAVRSSRLPGLLLRAVGATAWVHGSCVGAGIELPAFCPLVVAAPGTTFRLPEVPMGLVPGAGGTASIVRRVGRHRTAFMALAATPVDTTTALEWGLVDAVRELPGVGNGPLPPGGTTGSAPGA
ncbi:MAG TPA: enoyl-CoA hydratase/isomerase family protein [Acidimicrobiales bacterium]|jgi:enoyl-CoA hydratase/carnithine racemase